ncbi:hypothetical protein [Rhodoferax sp.]|uniref:hypothetical protein n=1 Tax=Rhodoferax sp. TaxID=50421 RepID=UPI0025E77A27|nr:hypothetical protein [Rhodoferax sp.]
MKIETQSLRVREADEVDLDQWETEIKPLCKSKKAYRKLLEDQVEALSDLQRLCSTRRTATPCWWCSRRWTRRARTAPSAT